MTTNLQLAEAPDNVLVKINESGLPQDSVVNVSQVIAVDKSFLTEKVSQISARVMLLVEDGLRLVLSL